jgi:aminoglycoside 3-N-acetyltransferase I
MIVRSHLKVNGGHGARAKVVIGDAMRCLQPPAFVVRALTPADLPYLRRLNLLFGEAFNDADAYCSAPPADYYVRQLLADAHTIVLAALVGAEVAGGLVAYELRKFEQKRSEIYLYDLAVAADFRRRGMASALLDRLCLMAGERGASCVFVQADYVDPPAIALYEKFGTREEVLHFDIRPRTIPPAPSGKR